MTFRTATKFSGLSDFPNSLSEVQPGALQRASNVVLDRPGLVAPRRGQRPDTLYDYNLLTVDQARPGGPEGTTTGYDSYSITSFGTLDPGPDLVGLPAPAGALGDGEIRVTYPGGPFTAGAGFQFTPPAVGDYTISVYLRKDETNTGATVTLIDDTNTLHGTDTVALTSFVDWTRVDIQFTSTGQSFQIIISEDIEDQPAFLFSNLQLERGSVATVWTLPGGLVCSRLFQVRDNLYGFFTADGLPTSPGRFIRIVSTVDGGTQPLAAQAIFETTPNFFYPPPANAVHSFQANGNTFFSTNDGIMKLLADLTGDESGAIVPAGMPYGLDLQAALATPAAGTLGWLAGGYATAYRVVWGNTDPQGNLTLGAPSPPVIISNPVQDEQGQLNTLGVPAAPYLDTAWSMRVNLPWTASQTITYRDAWAVQGGTISACDVYVTNGSAIATVIFTDQANYYGPAGTPVSIVLQGAATAYASPTLTFVTGFVQSTGWTTATTPLTIYQPFDSGSPGTTAGVSAQSAILAAPSTTTVTVTAGSPFTPGPIGVIAACTVYAEQANQVPIYVAGGSIQLPEVGDSLALPGVTGRVVVTAVVASGFASGADLMTLDVFPTGLRYDGDGLFDIYRPATVDIDFVVPAEAYLYTATSTGQATASFYQVYRSRVQAEIVEGVEVSPTDDMQLAYQAEITGTSGSATISFEDIAPDATLGVTLYTSPSQPGGILAARYQPPVASDMTNYLNSALFANCELPARFDSQLLGVSTANSSTANLQPGDKITINGFDFTAVTPGPPAAYEFVISAGSGSVTADNTATVVNLSRAINEAYVQAVDAGAAGEMVTLLSTASPGTMGGTFTIQTSRGLGTFTFTFTADPGSPHDSPFSQLPASTIVPQTVQNALYYSPPSQPEACPLTNFYNVGQSNYPIQRVMTLPGSCIVFKPYECTFQLPGVTAAQLSVQQFNTTIQLLANESAVALQSTIMCFTNQGVVTVSGNGIQITSLPINDSLLALNSLPAFASTAFAVAHEAERRYMLWAPTAEEDTLPTQAYSYNLLTNAWSVWPLARVCGLANEADQLLYTGGQEDTTVYGEPALYKEASLGPAGSHLNYGDEAAYGAYNASSNPLAGTINSLPSGSPPRIIAAFGQGSALLVTLGNGVKLTAVVDTLTEVNDTALDVTFLTALEMGIETAGTCILVQATECVFAPVPIVADDAGSVKQFQEFVFNFNSTSCADMECVTASDFGQDPTVLPLTLYNQVGGQPGVGWGFGPWGGFPWGGGTPANATFVQSARQLVPIIAARGHNWWPTVTARVALNYFAVQGLTLAWNPTRTLRAK